MKPEEYTIFIPVLPQDNLRGCNHETLLVTKFVSENEKVCSLPELACLVDYLKDILALSISNQTTSKIEDTDGLPRSTRDCGCLGDCQYNVYLKDSEIFIPQQGLNRLKITVSAYPRVRIIRERVFSFFDVIGKFLTSLTFYII